MNNITVKTKHEIKLGVSDFALCLEEGKTALNLAFETADANGCQYILANDPDADRLAVCQNVDGKWRIFSGNELGALIGWWMFKVKISFICLYV